MKNIEAATYRVDSEIKLSDLNTREDLESSDKKLRKALESVTGYRYCWEGQLDQGSIQRF